MESDPIMQQDVFGPVLPILTVNNIDEAISFINKQEKALCVYAYSSNRKVELTRNIQHASVAELCSYYSMCLARAGHLKTNERDL